jgi:hypothetical protein
VSYSEDLAPSTHTIYLGECMEFVTAALQCDGQGDRVQYFLAHAAHKALLARKASYTRAEQVAAEYMVNFVKDVRVAIRRGGLARLDEPILEKN